jgi:bifunctional pyridoxal-dependent enzyme with beta-cystathionase and maltose regulon repressor activities
MTFALFQLHMMARKGDSVAPTMETLLSLRFRQGTGNKVYTGNVKNGKDFLPIHIAAMSTKCPQNILRILRNDFEQSFYGRTSDGSLPLHLVRKLKQTKKIFLKHKNI